MPNNRIDPTAAPTSPTGQPILPPKAVPWLIALVGAAWTATEVLPPHTIAYKVAWGIAGIGALLGIASPGMRRKP